MAYVNTNRRSSANRKPAQHHRSQSQGSRFSSSVKKSRGATSSAGSTAPATKPPRQSSYKVKNDDGSVSYFRRSNGDNVGPKPVNDSRFDGATWSNRKHGETPEGGSRYVNLSRRNLHGSIYRSSFSSTQTGTEAIYENINVDGESWEKITYRRADSRSQAPKTQKNLPSESNNQPEGQENQQQQTLQKNPPLPPSEMGAPPVDQIGMGQTQETPQRQTTEPAPSKKKDAESATSEEPANSDNSMLNGAAPNPALGLGSAAPEPQPASNEDAQQPQERPPLTPENEKQLPKQDVAMTGAKEVSEEDEDAEAPLASEVPNTTSSAPAPIPVAPPTPPTSMQAPPPLNSMQPQDKPQTGAMSEETESVAQPPQTPPNTETTRPVRVLVVDRGFQAESLEAAKANTRAHHGALTSHIILEGFKEQGQKVELDQLDYISTDGDGNEVLDLGRGKVSFLDGQTYDYVNLSFGPQHFNKVQIDTGETVAFRNRVPDVNQSIQAYNENFRQTGQGELIDTSNGTENLSNKQKRDLFNFIVDTQNSAQLADIRDFVTGQLEKGTHVFQAAPNSASIHGVLTLLSGYNDLYPGNFYIVGSTNQTFKESNRNIPADQVTPSQLASFSATQGVDFFTGGFFQRDSDPQNSIAGTSYSTPEAIVNFHAQSRE